ncbi:MAG TPA: hypothetical protein VLV83_00910 [Acidobacteriota bacterium]|nr:hypothetical protein [Acidobacteriota bacterium]
MMPDNKSKKKSQEGFGLVEVMLAGLILLVGMVTLLALFAQAIAATQIANLDLIARQKAREALESLYTARNTRQFTFEQLANVDQGGVFLSGLQPLTTPGSDGLVNTADDGAVEKMISAGPDGTMGTGDDETRLLSDYRREIEISGGGSADLRRVTITITYTTPLGTTREVRIESFVSRFR